MKEKKIDELDYDFCNASSATDCTGLIPSLPQSDDEIRSYEELYDFLPRAADGSTENQTR
ncbi:hypothetical protein [Lachnotalea sp. AF33-28]|uniref:hypothetical protein n=1 Tax=Lachnotalea sp. AF33-28 TaxID=2292046 RepID=UPI000E46F6A3|nr:hypothetical protein [Lachnotalea sp. AF33-28]RHP32820.1 hypothetical protein DWZ56_12980 [Lachnotalea sp. AF33-28]